MKYRKLNCSRRIQIVIESVFCRFEKRKTARELLPLVGCLIWCPELLQEEVELKLREGRSTDEVKQKCQRWIDEKMEVVQLICSRDSVDVENLLFLQFFLSILDNTNPDHLFS